MHCSIHCLYFIPSCRVHSYSCCIRSFDSSFNKGPWVNSVIIYIICLWVIIYLSIEFWIVSSFLSGLLRYFSIVFWNLVLLMRILFSDCHSFGKSAFTSGHFKGFCLSLRWKHSFHYYVQRYVVFICSPWDLVCFYICKFIFSILEHSQPLVLQTLTLPFSLNAVRHILKHLILSSLTLNLSHIFISLCHILNELLVVLNSLHDPKWCL